MYYETANIKRYIKNTQYTTKDNEKRKRTIETVTIKGLKKSSKFKDNEPIIIINENDFNQMQTELKQLREQNNELINNIQTENEPEKATSNIKLLELYEQINNKNELLFNASNNYNNVIDLIIKELNKEYKALINKSFEDNKKALDLYLKELEQKNKELINNVIEDINKDLTSFNNEFNNIGFISLYKKRHDININLNLDRLENFNFLGSGFGSDNIFSLPDVNIIDVENVKNVARNELDFKEFYINFSRKNSLIDL